MYINTVHFFSKTLGGGGENNPVRSSISNQFYLYAKYDKNSSISFLMGASIYAPELPSISVQL